MADEPALRIGDTGEWVTYLQQLLEHLGFGSGFTAGQFDEATQNTLMQAQQQCGLNATGACDSDTWAALTSTNPAANASNASTAGDGADTGDSGDIAISMQDEVAAPDGEVMLSELDDLPQSAVC